MASWLRLNEDMVLNLDNVSHVDFADDPDTQEPVAYCWLVVAAEGDESDPTISQVCALVRGDDAVALKHYLRHTAADVHQTSFPHRAF